MADKITPDNIEEAKTTSPADEAAGDTDEVKSVDTETQAATEDTTTSPDTKPVLVPEEMLIASPSVSDTYKEDFDKKYHTMKKVLDAQPKIMTFIPPDDPKSGRPEWQYVCINGYPLWIMKGVFVEVPQQVAEMIKESYGLTYAAGKDKLANSNQAKIDALSR